MVALVDRDPIAIRIGHRERPPEWAVERLLKDRHAGGLDPVVERLGVAGSPPELDRRALACWHRRARRSDRRDRERRPADERDGIRSELERVADRAEVHLVPGRRNLGVRDGDRDEPRAGGDRG